MRATIVIVAACCFGVVGALVGQLDTGSDASTLTKFFFTVVGMTVGGALGYLVTYPTHGD